MHGSAWSLESLPSSRGTGWMYFLMRIQGKSHSSFFRCQAFAASFNTTRNVRYSPFPSGRTRLRTTQTVTLFLFCRRHAGEGRRTFSSRNKRADPFATFSRNSKRFMSNIFVLADRHSRDISFGSRHAFLSSTGSTHISLPCGAFASLPAERTNFFSPRCNI